MRKFRALIRVICRLIKKNVFSKAIPCKGLKVHKISNIDDYYLYNARISGELESHLNLMESLSRQSDNIFFVDGYSYVAGQQVQFIVEKGDDGHVNWRESVNCQLTGFNNRMRATFQMFDFEMGAYSDSEIYINEQVTPIYDYFASRFENVTGSEYVGDNVVGGTVNSAGVRHEDLTKLSFSDEVFDHIISLDVLEHIPDYQTAFSECYRVLKKGGRFMWSVPFIATNAENSIRAKINDDGCIQYILPAEYHGDPMSDKGVLCFQHFGWEMLEQIRSCGFKNVYAMCYWSSDFGYLGGEQFLFFAEK